MNNWIVKTRRGNKVVSIDPGKHAVILGVLYERATMKRIGQVLRMASL